MLPAPAHPDASSAPRLAWAEDLALVARDWSDELARFLVGGFEHIRERALPDPSRDWFSDSPDSVHADDIRRAVDAGWVAGYPD